MNRDYQDYLEDTSSRIKLGVGEMIARAFVLYPMIFVLAYLEDHNLYVAIAWLLLSIIGTGLAAYAIARYTIYGERWNPLSAEEYAKITALYMDTTDE